MAGKQSGARARARAGQSGPARGESPALTPGAAQVLLRILVKADEKQEGNVHARHPETAST